MATEERMRDTKTRTGDRGGYRIRETQDGWVCETWSRVSGETTGRRALVPYAAAPHLAGMALDATINDYLTTVADAVLRISHDETVARTIRRGIVVR